MDDEGLDAVVGDVVVGVEDGVGGGEKGKIEALSGSSRQTKEAVLIVDVAI